MRKDREQAIVLRKSGMSYSEIIARMAVPRSTLSDWFSREKWSNDIARKCVARSQIGAGMRFMVLNTIRGNRLRKVYEDSKQDALVDFEELKYHPLFIAGIMAYSAHGDKTSRHRVVFSSSNPKIVRIFILFLRNICGLDNFSARLTAVPSKSKQKSEDRPNNQQKEGNYDEYEQEALKYWVDKTGLKYEQFAKKPIIFSKISINSGKIHSGYGICNIVLSSAYLKSKFLKWIELMVDEIGEEKYSFSEEGSGRFENNAGIV